MRRVLVAHDSDLKLKQLFYDIFTFFSSQEQHCKEQHLTVWFNVLISDLCFGLYIQNIIEANIKHISMTLMI